MGYVILQYTLNTHMIRNKSFPINVSLLNPQTFLGPIDKPTFESSWELKDNVITNLRFLWKDENELKIIGLKTSSLWLLLVTIKCLMICFMLINFWISMLHNGLRLAIPLWNLIGYIAIRWGSYNLRAGKPPLVTIKPRRATITLLWATITSPRSAVDF